METPWLWRILLGARHVLLVDILKLTRSPPVRACRARNAQRGGGALLLGCRKAWAVRIVVQVFILTVKEVHHVRHALPENLLISKIRRIVNYVLQDNIVAPMMMRDRAKLATKENIREKKVKDCAFLASPVNIMIKQAKHHVLIVP